MFDAQGLRPSALAVRGRNGAVSVRDVSALPDGAHAWSGRAFAVERGGLGAQFLPQSLIASIHVPRAGGTTLRTWLQRQWGQALVPDYDDQPLSSDYDVRVRAARAGAGRFLPATARAVHGHFLASKYRDASPRLAIWFREPVERTASHHRFWRRTAGDGDPNATKRRFLAEGRDLAGFAEMPELRDVHARFMDGVPLAGFAFVGVFEQFARGVRLFARLFGLPDPGDLAALNANPREAAREEAIPADVRERIAGLNRRDRELYAAATERFEALCREHGVG